MSRLSDKYAFVTGAGGGIGRAICERFLAEGAHVTASDISKDAAEESIATAARGQAIALSVDAGDSAAVRAAIAQAVAEFGRLNVLCNVAGGSSTADGDVTEASEDEFWRVIRLDLFGPFVSCRHGIPELIKDGGGSVINMTSMGALIALPERDCYTSAKGGIAAMTRSMAQGYGKHGIRVNAIAPGITLTPRVQARVDDPKIQSLKDRHLLGLVEPVDVAHMAVFLASEESRVITGQVLSVDSGVTIT